ncbi:MAG: NAD(P)-dependent oxidoreductase [Bacteroidota bacterium]
MKILVTGSSGFLGEALMIRFKELQTAVIGTDILPGPHTDQVGDLRDRSFVDQLMPGVTAIIHTATLHKPHIVTHTKADFISTNITATLHLLEAAVAHHIKTFVFTSTTSTFGDSMVPATGEPAVMVTEDLVPRPKNIYGATKTAAEDVCQIFHRNYGINCLILRTSRFFREEDDNPKLRGHYQDDNIKVNELLYRRADIEDIVDAHLLALDKAAGIGFSKFIISATSPFQVEDLPQLNLDTSTVVEKYVPGFRSLYAKLDWQMFPKITRVYDNTKARQLLGWEPKYDFRSALAALSKGTDYRSPLTYQVAPKRYHQETFDDGPYPV